jgi:hypothetical protein
MAEQKHQRYISDNIRFAVVQMTDRRQDVDQAARAAGITPEKLQLALQRPAIQALIRERLKLAAGAQAHG